VAATASTGDLPYRIITNPETGKQYRVGEDPKQLIGYGRWVPILAAWAAMFMAGILEYTWGALSGSMMAQHGWSLQSVFWMFSVYIIFESVASHPMTGFLRDHGILKVRYAVAIGAVLCGVVAYGLTATASSAWQLYLGYAFFGGIGSGMIYSSCINMTGKWYPDKQGWRNGFVDGGWAYGAVPWILVIGGFAGDTGGANLGGFLTPFIWIQGISLTVIVLIAAFFMKDPPKNWWPKSVDPLNWAKYKKGQSHDLVANPPALKQYSTREMWRTPQPKWIGIQFALFVGASLFGVSYLFPFGEAMHLGIWAAAGGFAGFSLADGIFRPIYGYISQWIGRRMTMTYAYAVDGVFVLLTLWAGEAGIPWLFAVLAVITGGLSGANFPMTSTIITDYFGSNNNAINYATIYSFKAIGGSFAGGIAALVMTGGVEVAGKPHWVNGFIFGAVLAFLATLVVYFLCKAPTLEQMKKAEAGAAEAAARRAAKRGEQASRSAVT
jgi:MFS family permease